jgi:predicted RND superfamily exporter protein
VNRLKSSTFCLAADLVCRHPWMVLAVAVVVTVAGMWLVSDLEVINDITQYLPQDSGVVQEYKKALSHFGTAEQLLIVLQGTGEDDLEAREDLADAMAERLLESQRVRGVTYRITNQIVQFSKDTFLRYGLLYLEPHEREGLLDLLTDRSIEEQVAANREILLSPATGMAQELVRWDPLNLRSLFMGRIERGKGQLKVEHRDGYFFSDDLTLLVMVVRPTTKAQDILFTRELMKETRAIEAAAREELREAGWDDIDSVQVGYTGGYAIALEYNRMIERDLRVSMAVAFVGVMILFGITFRRLGSLFYVGVPLLMSLVWTLALARLVYGSINLFTSVGTAVLLGLGIDFAIHIMNRFLAEMEEHGDVNRAIHVTLLETGDGAVAACATTMLAFYACMLTTFPGLQQLGLIAGTGLLLALLANFLVLPAFLVVYTRLTKERTREMTGLGLEPLARLVRRHPVFILILAVVVTVICVAASLQISIETDLTRFRPLNSEAFGLQRLVMDKIGSNLTSTMILASAPTEEEALDLSTQISEELKRLEARQLVSSSLSVNTVLPSHTMEQANLQWAERMRRQRPDALDPARVVTKLRGELDRNGFDPDAFEQAYRMIEAFLGVREELSLEQLKNTALGRYAERFVSHGDDGTYVATYVYTPHGEGLTKKEQVRILDRRMQQLGGNVHVISHALLGPEVARLMKRDAMLATSVALLMVLGALYLQFRSFRLMFLTALPLLLGVSWALGAMVLGGYRFSLLTVSILPVILGIGIDDGIYVVNRYRSLGDRDVAHAFHDTGRAVLVTSLTTMVGFGSLVLADYPGLVGAGLLAFVGIGCCLITTVTVLPALMELFGRGLIDRKALAMPDIEEAKQRAVRKRRRDRA